MWQQHFVTSTQDFITRETDFQENVETQTEKENRNGFSFVTQNSEFVGRR